MASENNEGCSVTIGLGNIVAVVVSWSVNQSIGWAIVHGFFGWFYLIYYALIYGI